MKTKKRAVADFETSDLNHLHGQVLSGHIKIFENGKEIDSLDTHCRMEKARLPSAYALAVNNYSTENLKQSQSLREMMVEVYQFIEKHGPLEIIAHNAHFDFKFAHSHYFQSLVTDDWYQWKSKNSVIDSLELLRSIHLFKAELNTISIPMSNFAFPIYSLGRVCNENGIFYEQHTAEGDVKSLADLYGLMINEAPEIVNQAQLCTNKYEVRRIVNDSMFFCAAIGTGPSLKARALVPLAINKFKNALICVDISMIKPHELNALTSWDLFTQMKNTERENAIVMVPLNKGKVFFPPEYHVFCKSRQSIAKGNELMECAKKVRKNMYIKEVAQEAWKHYENIFSNDGYLESSIYEGGWCTPVESNFIYQFNATNWDQRWQLVESTESSLGNNRVRQLAKRLIFDHDQSLLPNDLVQIYEERIRNKLFDPDASTNVPWVNLPKVLNELEELKSDSIDQDKLKELQAYYEDVSDGLLYSKSMF